MVVRNTILFCIIAANQGGPNQTPQEVNWYFCVWLYVCRLNSTVECIPYHLQLSPENALQLIQQYPAANVSSTCRWLNLWYSSISQLPINLLPCAFLLIYWVGKFVNVTKQWYKLCLWWHLDFADLMYDIVADCSDNVPTRYLVNDACVLSGKPLVSASALRMEGQVS